MKGASGPGSDPRRRGRRYAAAVLASARVGLRRDIRAPAPSDRQPGLELIPVKGNKPSDNTAPDFLIEARIPAQPLREMGFREGETLVVTPRGARVFVESAI
jgi:hypothetical protein